MGRALSPARAAGEAPGSYAPAEACAIAARLVRRRPPIGIAVAIARVEGTRKDRPMSIDTAGAFTTANAARSLPELLAAKNSARGRARRAASQEPLALVSMLRGTKGSAQPEKALLGDLNGDGRVTTQDSKALLEFLYLGGAAPKHLENADINQDGRVDLSDVIKLSELANAYKGKANPEALTS